jgi:sigma-B regulation protein RsbU (phosphoserine phosphatase)
MVVALAAIVVAIVAVDIAAGPQVSLIGLLVAAPLLASLRLGRRATAGVGALAVVVALALGFPSGFFGAQNHLTRVLPVLVASLIGVWAAGLRSQRERAVALLTVQSSVAGILNESRWIGDAGPRILRVLAEALDCKVGSIWLVDGDALRRGAQWTADGFESSAFDDLGDRISFERRVGLPGTVWETRAPVLVPDLERTANFPRAEAAARAGLRSGFAFPITSGDEVVAVAELFCTSRLAIGRETRGTLAGLGRQIGMFIERTRLLEEHSYIARTLQESLLPPTLPEIARVEVGTRYHAAGEANEVGGDFYDLFQMAEGEWAAVIGDVKGKGPDAAAMIGLARHTLRAGAMRESDHTRVLTTLNEALSMEGGEDSICTALLATIRPFDDDVEVEVTSAGHPLPLVLRADGAVETVGTPGTLVGAVSDLELSPERVSLATGDALVLFTDGVFEAGTGADRFGHGRLEALLRECRGAAASEVAGRIERDVLDFQGGEATDDLAVMVLRSRAGPGANEPAPEAIAATRS